MAAAAFGLLQSSAIGVKEARRGVLKRVLVAGAAVISAGVCAGTLGARSFGHLVRNDVDTMFAKASTDDSLP